MKNAFAVRAEDFSAHEICKLLTSALQRYRGAQAKTTSTAPRTSAENV